MLEYNKSSGAWRVIVAIFRTGAIADDSIDTRIKRYLQYGCWDAFEIPATLDGEFLGKEKLKIKLSATVSNAIESIQKSHLLSSNFKRNSIIGSSKAIMSILETLEQASKEDFPLLITGETGTGKELFAAAAHENSQRSKNAMISLDCGSLPETTINGELFGYKKGAHSLADEPKDGLIKIAHESTLFLDEIGNLPISLQPVLLRVLDRKEVWPLGALKPEKVDFRLICATNEDLSRKISNGTFREDLYHRINVVSIHIPPLRDRKDDVIDIAEFFLNKAKKQGKIVGFTQEFLNALKGYHWPGNVRELQNAINMARISARGVENLTPHHLPAIIFNHWIATVGHVVHKPTDDEQAEIWKEVLISPKNESSHQRLPYEMDYEDGNPLSLGHLNDDIKPDLPGADNSSVEITPENIIEGKIKWKQLKTLSYHKRVSIMVAAKSLWMDQQQNLAKLLEVKPNTLDRFFSTAKTKAEDGDLNVDQLKPHLDSKHHLCLEKFFVPLRKS